MGAPFIPFSTPVCIYVTMATNDDFNCNWSLVTRRLILLEQKNVFRVFKLWKLKRVITKVICPCNN